MVPFNRKAPFCYGPSLFIEPCEKEKRDFVTDSSASIKPMSKEKKTRHSVADMSVSIEPMSRKEFPYGVFFDTGSMDTELSVTKWRFCFSGNMICA